MITVTSAFMDIWRNSADKFTVRVVKYKRRYWNGSAFVYETDWNELALSDFQQIGSISQQLDTVTQNEFKNSNLTLYLANQDNQWLPSNQGGVFGVDNVATLGYEPYKTLFQIEAGYTLSTGVDERIIVFTGYLVDFNISSSVSSVELTLTDGDILLDDADAQNVSNLFTNESTVPATGDSSNKEFYTTSEGVDYLSKVRVGGIEKIEGLEYSVSNTSKKNEGALITFENAPDVSAVDASGRKWLEDQKIEDLIALLATEAGVTSTDIKPVAFPNLIPSIKTIDSQAEWQNTGYANSNTDTSTEVGSVKTALLAIPPLESDSTGYGTILSIAYNSASWMVNLSRDGGVFRFLYRSYVSMNVGRPSYYIKRVYTSSYISHIELYREDSDGEIGPPVTTLLGSSGTIMGWQDKTLIHITRDESTGRILVRIPDYGHVIDVTDTTYNATVFTDSRLYGTSGDYAMVLPNVVDNTNGVFKADQCVYESGEHDLLSAPLQWGPLTKYVDLNGGTVAVQFKTASSPGGTYEAYTSLDAFNIPQSTLNRYFKFKLTFNHQYQNYLSPVVSKITLAFYATTVQISLANFANSSVQQAIQRLAKLCNYEKGFTNSGVLFFRPKNVLSSPVLSIDQNDIIEVLSLKPGWSAVKNSYQARYNEYYYKVYDSSSLPEAEPTSEQIYGKRIQNEDLQSYLLSNDADIATGYVRAGHDGNYLKRLNVRLSVRMIPFLELSDIITVSFCQDPLQEINVFGDPMQEHMPSFGESNDASLLNGKIMKVVGIIKDFETESMELTLLEVL